MLPIVMPVAQWAPWVSVFLGGCLSGAALLSLSAAPESKAVTVPPSQVVAPAEPVDEHDAEAPDEEVADAPADQERAADPSDHEPEHPADEAGPSAADVLAELERAYQLQVAEAAAAAPAPEAAPADDVAAAAEDVPPDANPPAAPNSVPAQQIPEAAPPDRRLAVAEEDAEDETHSRDADPEASRSSDDLDQAQLQQIAVIYQPVYVLPTAVAPGEPTTTLPASRPIGLDPWTGVSWGMQNPWATAPQSGGAWATIGVSGGSWSAGFISRP